MDYILSGLSPEKVLKNFEDISRIPRASGNEKTVSDHIFSFAKTLGLEAYQDQYYNLIIKKKATNGFANPSTVMLQAHMDMVAEASDFSHHDFEKDGLTLVVSHSKIRADHTTLGADNGIGVAYMMAILESTDIIHPNLECVFTVEEEKGLIGANKLDYSLLKSTYLINLDNEEENFITVGCAGGINSKLILRKEYKPAHPRNVALEINVKGLFGGHSGMEIDKQRGNANKIMGRILRNISYDFDIFTINGGSKRNAIPRSCESIISVSNEDLENIVKEIQRLSAKIQKEYYNVDPNLKIELRRSAPTEFKVFTDDCKDKIINLMTLIPDGIITMSTKIPDLVETSSNFAVIKEIDNNIEFLSMTRSGVNSKKDYVNTIFDTLSKLTDTQLEFESEYPAWEYKENSKLEALAADLFLIMFNKVPIISTVHCGLESGIILNNLKHRAEAISIGPNMYNVHTPYEYVEIDSIARIWDFLLEILKNIDKED